MHDASVGVVNGTEIFRSRLECPMEKGGIILRISTFVEKFDLNELKRNFPFPLQIISARLLSTSDIYPVPIAEKHMY